jgi:alpha/beta superfamily hydrolase
MTEHIFRTISNSFELEAILDIPNTSDLPACVVLCSPSPKFGGDMSNNVISAIHHKLIGSNIATLRFNYGGVGKSQGKTTNGPNEILDTKNILAKISYDHRIDGSKIGIIGYSFGGWMALEASIDNHSIKTIVTVSCPQNKLSLFSTTEIVQPKLFILGDKDHDFPVGQFNFITNRFNNPKQSEIITKGDHFLVGQEELVADLAMEFFQRTL